MKFTEFPKMARLSREMIISKKLNIMIKVINLNTGEGYNVIHFPDGQPHINIPKEDDGFVLYDVVCSITSAQRLLELQMIADAIDNLRQCKCCLHIPYLMGARFDRVHDMKPGDSFDLRVIAKVINSLEFGTVYLYDPHSDVSPALINNCMVVTNKKLVDAYTREDSVLIVPDAGAAKKAHQYIDWNKNIVMSTQCAKHRDLGTGKVYLEVLDPRKCAGMNCVIIDDICDGGATFLAIAKDLRGKGYNPLSLTLIVTHGIFSKGFELLNEYFDEIICSKSYTSQFMSPRVRKIDILELHNDD